MNVEANKLFKIDNLSRTRSNGKKLRCRQIELDCTKFVFINDVVREWNKVPPSVVQCSTVNSLKNKLDHHLLQQGLRYRLYERRTAGCLTMYASDYVLVRLL